MKKDKTIPEKKNQLKRVYGLFSGGGKRNVDKRKEVSVGTKCG